MLHTCIRHGEPILKLLVHLWTSWALLVRTLLIWILKERENYRIHNIIEKMTTTNVCGRSLIAICTNCIEYLNAEQLLLVLTFYNASACLKHFW